MFFWHRAHSAEPNKDTQRTTSICGRAKAPICVHSNPIRPSLTRNWASGMEFLSATQSGRSEYFSHAKQGLYNSQNLLQIGCFSFFQQHLQTSPENIRVNFFSFELEKCGG